MSEEQKEQTKSANLYPVDAQDYVFKINLRDESNPLYVEHKWKRLPLKDKSKVDWVTYEEQDSVRVRTGDKSKEQSYENRAVSSRLWLANNCTIAVRGYPQPIAPTRDTEVAVDTENIKLIPYDHRERAAQLFLDIEAERLAEDDELSLLLGTGATRVEVKHLGHTFVVALNKTEEGRVYYESHVRHLGSRTEGKSSVSIYGLKIENACKLFDKWFVNAEDVSVGDAPYDTSKRDAFLREFCPLLKLQVVATVFEQVLKDAGN